jgi:membrane-associated phospholipid phosphatase
MGGSVASLPMETADAPATRAERQHRTQWWKEALIMGAFYLVYSWSRNQFGSSRIAADGVPEQAFHNAERVIRWEQAVGLYHESTVQSWFLDNTRFIQFWNAYYGTAHFFVTIAVFIVLFRRRPDVFPLWRNTLAAMTALAIVGFSLFPLMPPRLLDAPCPKVDNNEYGGRCIVSDLRGAGPDGVRERPWVAPYDADDSFGFVDTLVEIGGPWSFESETMTSISNQYAAMPSLHIGWSSWCAFALYPIARRWRWRIALLFYPAATLFCIVVTGNHYWIDGLVGLLALAVGFAIGWGLDAANQWRLTRKTRVPVSAI